MILAFRSLLERQDAIRALNAQHWNRKAEIERRYYADLQALDKWRDEEIKKINAQPVIEVK